MQKPNSHSLKYPLPIKPCPTKPNAKYMMKKYHKNLILVLSKITCLNIQRAKIFLNLNLIMREISRDKNNLSLSHLQVKNLTLMIQNRHKIEKQRLLLILRVVEISLDISLI